MGIAARVLEAVGCVDEDDGGDVADVAEDNSRLLRKPILASTIRTTHRRVHDSSSGLPSSVILVKPVQLYRIGGPTVQQVETLNASAILGSCESGVRLHRVVTVC